ncbi:MAG: hypothetical protein WB609_05695 [Candidatus Cybelea sp.]
MIAVARRIEELGPAGIKRVAIDGVDGCGKSAFGDALAAVFGNLDRFVIRASVDDFHNPREVRYRLGRESPDGFYLDSYDYPAFIERLLRPLSPDGSRRYRLAAFDHVADRPVDAEERRAPEDAVLIVDGIFLHRAELRSFWDLSVFLDVPFEVSIPRGAARGESWGDPDLTSQYNRRYVEGQRRYLRECGPRERATIVIDNTDLSDPRIVRG